MQLKKEYKEICVSFSWFLQCHNHQDADTDSPEGGHPSPPGSLVPPRPLPLPAS